MQRHIHLSRIDTPTPAHREYPAALMQEAREALAAIDLRYDNATGVMRDKWGERERFSNPTDHTPHESLDDVMQWEFSRYIANAASRKSRGYSLT